MGRAPASRISIYRACDIFRAIAEAGRQLSPVRSVLFFFFIGPIILAHQKRSPPSSFPFVFSAVSLASPPGSFLGFHEAICWFGSLLHVALMLFVDCFWSPSKVRFISSECARFVSFRFVSFHFMSPFSHVRQFWSDWLARLVTR